MAIRQMEPWRLADTTASLATRTIANNQIANRLIKVRTHLICPLVLTASRITQTQPKIHQRLSAPPFCRAENTAGPSLAIYASRLREN